MKSPIQKKINYQAYINRESHYRHHRYDEELKQYYSIKTGDVTGAKQAGHKMFTSHLTGKLSNNELRDKKYLFVASTTLATRFAIQGGMREEDAYNMSDLYIQTMDKCSNVQAVIDLQVKMLIDFASGVQIEQKNRIQRLPILRAIEYIEEHLHESIHLKEIATAIGYSEKYLAKIFKEETQQTVQHYIQHKKIQVAQNMLRDGDFSILEVSDTLSFSSQSYFSKIFRQHVGLTPKQFKMKIDDDIIHH